MLNEKKKNETLDENEEIIYVDEEGNEISPEDLDESLEEIIYVDEDGNEISPEELEQVIYVDEEGNEISPEDMSLNESISETYENAVEAIDELSEGTVTEEVIEEVVTADEAFETNEFTPNEELEDVEYASYEEVETDDLISNEELEEVKEVVEEKENTTIEIEIKENKLYGNQKILKYAEGNKFLGLKIVGIILAVFLGVFILISLL